MNEVATTDHPNAPPLAMPVASSAQHVAQTTAIEQSRATAEVQAAMVVAQRFPRNEQHALGRVLAACGRQTMAQRSFYSYSRGGSTVSEQQESGGDESSSHSLHARSSLEACRTRILSKSSVLPSMGAARGL